MYSNDDFDEVSISFLKDLNSKYLHISKRFCNYLGWKDKSYYGKTDYDIPCRACEYADGFIEFDKKVLVSGNNLITLDVMPYADGWRVFMLEKKLLEDKTGVSGNAIDITNTPLFSPAILLHSNNCKYTDVFEKPTSYILSEEHAPLPITKQQQICLFYLVRGKSAKEIAHILGKSARTIEKHITQLKEKLECYSKSQLIEKAIDSGFFFYIPKQIIF